jgi:hypothetical protein
VRRRNCFSNCPASLLEKLDSWGKIVIGDKTLGVSLSPRNKIPKSPMEDKRKVQMSESKSACLAYLNFIILKEFYFMNVFFTNQKLI